MLKLFSKSLKRPLNISQTIAIIFLVIILTGSILLCLPISSRNGTPTGFLTALFTATSSTCVTGLVLGDTFSLWSGFGQIVILCLIEIGGLGFMSVTSSVFFIFRKKINMKERAAIAFSVGSDDINDAVRIQKKVLLYSLLTECIGAIILTIRFCSEFSFLQSLKLGIFHSVSAFCNAGFDILGFKEPGSSLILYGTDTTIVLTLSLLIIFGGLGFIVWDEVFSPKSIKKWSVYTKLVLITTFALLIIGTILIGLVEWNNPGTLGNMTTFNKIKAAFFQSTTARTAGFAGVDQGKLTDSGKAITIFLMLIGGSSGSTAGGLKTVTLIVLVLFLWSRLTGKENIHAFNRRIPFRLVLNALTVFGAMITLSFFSGVFICSTSPVSFVNGLYEAVSAIATVGLTTGITTILSTASKLLIIVLMYFGRVGILTISFGFLQTTKSKEFYKYADTELLIG